MQQLFVGGEEPPPARVRCNCPTCGADTHLKYLGDQQWPQRVTQRMGISSPVVQLWQCESCHTTLTSSNGALLNS